MTREEVLESVGLVAFAAWCNTSPQLASTRQLWDERRGRLTMNQWNRVTERILEYAATQEGADHTVAYLSARLTVMRIVAVVGSLCGLAVGLFVGLAL